jgi:hypothetical protein
VWAERVRLIDDVRNVATSLFSLAEDASDRFPEDGEHRSGATVAAPPVMPAPKPAAHGAPTSPGAPNSHGAPSTHAASMAMPSAPKPVPAEKPAEDGHSAQGEGSSPTAPDAPTDG